MTSSWHTCIHENGPDSFITSPVYVIALKYTRLSMGMFVDIPVIIIVKPLYLFNFSNTFRLDDIISINEKCRSTLGKGGYPPKYHDRTIQRKYVLFRHLIYSDSATNRNQDFTITLVRKWWWIVWICRVWKHTPKGPSCYRHFTCPFVDTFPVAINMT